MVKKLLFFCFLFFLFTKVSIASTDPVTNTSNVSATVTSGYFYAPTLISPINGFSTNNSIFTFNWRRPAPTPATSLDHYDLYIDDVVYAPSILDTLVSQDYYFYSATASANLFYVTLKQSLSEGYHTWRVAVFDNIGTNAATGNWTFYLDSVPPFISLTKVVNTDYTWTTTDLSTIPAESNRYLSVSTANPVLKGKVETNANLLISLNCPSSPPPAGCSNQSWIINSTDGTWEKQFTNLIANINYTINLSATDATGNSTIFPVFYLKYKTITLSTSPTKAATVSATPTSLTPTSLPLLTPTEIALPKISSLLTPPPELAALITPSSLSPKTPPSPTLPPNKSKTPKTASGYGPYFLLFFLIIGLPLHLTMASFGLRVPLIHLTNFLFTLGFPFLKRQSTKTLPFSFVTLYDPQKLDKKLFSNVSDIKGNIFFPKGLPDRVLVSLSNTDLIFKNELYPTVLLNTTCLLPLPKRVTSTSETLRNNIFTLRNIPLIVAIITSSVGLYISPSIYIAIYLYLSAQYSFSEYYYPRTK